MSTVKKLAKSMADVASNSRQEQIFYFLQQIKFSDTLQVNSSFFNVKGVCLLVMSEFANYHTLFVNNVIDICLHLISNDLGAIRPTIRDATLLALRNLFGNLLHGLLY
jgi:hypothetical protein